MTGASIETTLELWASSLRDVKGHDVAFVHAGAGGGAQRVLFWTGFGAEPRKTGWMRAEAAGDRAPYASRRS